MKVDAILVLPKKKLMQVGNYRLHGSEEVYWSSFVFSIYALLNLAKYRRPQTSFIKRFNLGARSQRLSQFLDQKVNLRTNLNAS